MKKRVPSWIYPVLWVLFIFITSSSVVTQKQVATAISGTTGISQAAAFDAWKAIWWILVKGWHAAEFGILYALLRAALTRNPNRIKLASGIALTYALFDELHQVSVKSRGGQFSDVCIDAVGIALTYYLLDYPGKSKWKTALVVALAIVVINLLAIHPFGSFEGLF